MARPSKFDVDKDKCIEMAKLGLTDVQMANVLGVTEHTINNWKAKDNAFFQSLKEAKVMSDESVVKSLYQRATGYEHPEVHISNYQGEVTETPIVKHYAPDTTAMIFWLKNRQPDKWRDKQEIEQTNTNIDLNLSEEDRKARIDELKRKLES